MPEEQLSKHERRELKLEARREAKQNAIEAGEKKKLFSKITAYSIIALVVIGGIWFFLSLPKPEQKNYDVGGLSFPLGNIHWHATPTIAICGENVSLPKPAPGQHLGSGLLHMHDDMLFHIEGSVSSPSQITLGAMMSNIGKSFSQTTLLGKKNGDPCPTGKEGNVQLIVNGVENSEFENYIIKDGDKIEMHFE